MPEPSFYLIHDQLKEPVTEYRRTTEALEILLIESGRGQEPIKNLAVELQKEREDLKEILGQIPITDSEGLTLKAEAIRQGLSPIEQQEYVRTAASARLVLGANIEQINGASAAFVGDLRNQTSGLNLAMDLATMAKETLKADGGKVLSVMTGAQMSLESLNMQPHQIAALSMAAMGKFREDGTFRHKYAFGEEQTSAAFQSLGGLLNRVQVGDGETIAKLRAAGVNDAKLQEDLKTNPSQAVETLLVALRKLKDEQLPGQANLLFGDQSGPVIAAMAKNNAALPKLSEMAAQQAVGSLSSKREQLAKTASAQELIKANFDGRHASLGTAERTKALQKIEDDAPGYLAGAAVSIIVEKILERLLFGRKGKGGGPTSGPPVSRPPISGPPSGPSTIGPDVGTRAKEGLGSSPPKSLPQEKNDFKRLYMDDHFPPEKGPDGRPSVRGGSRAMGAAALMLALIEFLQNTLPDGDEMRQRVEKMNKEEEERRQKAIEGAGKALRYWPLMPLSGPEPASARPKRPPFFQDASFRAPDLSEQAWASSQPTPLQAPGPNPILLQLEDMVRMLNDLLQEQGTVPTQLRTMTEELAYRLRPPEVPLHQRFKKLSLEQALMEGAVNNW
ncbi:hypothetical protein ACFSM5_15745 [Lacibacterium aquatile]|uniref:Uncharacterized protein n=1 Tax=Lacibacterium aquatile TaxID=1168082 RepID=A0ABW5DTD5_9PROT